MKLKKICAALSAMILIFSAAGCSSNKVNKTPTKKVKLTGNIIVYGDQTDEKAVQSFISSFNKLNPEVKISYKSLSKRELENETSAKYDADKADKNDPVKLIISKDCYIPGILKQNSSSYIDLTKKIADYKNNFNKTLFDNLTYSNSIYAVPFSSSPEALLIRSDILESYSIDPNDIITWDDFALDGNMIFTKSKKSINILGMYNDDGSNLFNLMFNQLNASYKTNTETEKSNTELEKKLLKEIEYMNFQQTLLNSDINSCINNLKSGKLLSLYVSPGIAANIMETCPELKGKLKIMKVPSFEPGGNEDVKFSGKSVMIKTAKADTSSALEFIKYMTSNADEQIKVMKSSDYFPACSLAFNNTYFNNKVEYYNDECIWNLYSDIFENSPAIKYPDEYDIQEIKNNAALKKVISGMGNVNSALSELNN